MSTSDEPIIGRYEYIRYNDPADAFRPYDPRSPEVARRVIELITANLPDLRVEHVGSTAIPDCGGKGVIDLMAVYPLGMLDEAKAAIDRLGFQRHTGPKAFGEDRPVRIGTIEHDGDIFRLHVHVIATDDPEVAQQRHFRDTLKNEPALVKEYVARKREILTTGNADGDSYNDRKDPFIKSVMKTAKSGSDTCI